MSFATRLFTYQSTTTSSSLSVGELAYTAPQGGSSMITALWIAASSGGTANVVRLHHCAPDESPNIGNCLFRVTVSKDNSLLHSYFPVKIVMQPGEQLFAQLHSGNGWTLTAYGLVPVDNTIAGGRPGFEPPTPPQVMPEHVPNIYKAFRQ